MLYPLLTYIAPDGREIDFHCDGSTIGRSIIGLTDSEADYQTIKTPFVHGASLVAGVAKERIVSVPVFLRDTPGRAYRELIAQWTSVMNPFRDKSGKVIPGKLRYQGYKDDPVYEIDATPVGKPDIRKTLPTWQTRIYDFLCPNPFFRQLPVQVVSGSIGEAGFNIPWAVPTSITTGTTSVELWNFGNVPSPTQIEITGPASDIWIHHRETGALMRIFISLTADDTLVIDGETRTVKVGDVNAAGTLSTDSIYIDCMEGKNTFDVACDEGTPTVTIRSYSLVTGVN